MYVTLFLSSTSIECSCSSIISNGIPTPAKTVQPDKFCSGDVLVLILKSTLELFFIRLLTVLSIYINDFVSPGAISMLGIVTYLRVFIS